MDTKIEAKMDHRFRLTLPKEVQDALGLQEGDQLWFEKKPNGKIEVGRIEIKKKIID